MWQKRWRVKCWTRAFSHDPDYSIWCMTIYSVRRINCKITFYSKWNTRFQFPFSIMSVYNLEQTSALNSDMVKKISISSANENYQNCKPPLSPELLSNYFFNFKPKFGDSRLHTCMYKIYIYMYLVLMTMVSTHRYPGYH